MKLVDKPLTDMQKRFARLYVEAFYGNEYLSNTEVAIKAGYSPDSAYQRAYELLSPKISPHVYKYISQLKDDFRMKNNIDPDKHMAQLEHIKRLAIAHKNFGVAGRMEELRGKVAGYYIDRKEIKSNSPNEDPTEEELNQSMAKILREYKHFIWEDDDQKAEALLEKK